MCLAVEFVLLFLPLSLDCVLLGLELALGLFASRDGRLSSSSGSTPTAITTAVTTSQRFYIWRRDIATSGGGEDTAELGEVGHGAARCLLGGEHVVLEVFVEGGVNDEPGVRQVNKELVQ